MPGPLPKDPSTLRRPNKKQTKNALTLVTAVPSGPVPPLPSHQPWHPATVAWWNDVWVSPMAAEYHESDLHGLFILAALVDRFWYEPTNGLAAEIRLQRQCFGLTPLDRRRLQWEIDRGEEAEVSTAQRRAERRPTSTRPAKKDPRALLA